MNGILFWLWAPSLLLIAAAVGLAPNTVTGTAADSPQSV